MHAVQHQRTPKCIVHLSLPIQSLWDALRYCRVPKAPRQCRAVGYLIIWHGGAVYFECICTCLLYTAPFLCHLQALKIVTAGHRRGLGSDACWKGVLSFHSRCLFVCLFVCFLVCLFVRAISQPSFELGSWNFGAVVSKSFVKYGIFCFLNNQLIEELLINQVIN